MHYATLLEAASAIRSRKVSAVELPRAMLDRIAKLDPSLLSYATVTPELALTQAKAAEVDITGGNYAPVMPINGQRTGIIAILPSDSGRC